MFILSILGWISIAAGALGTWVGYSEENLFWIALGLSSILSGILFLAIDKGLTLLAQIRDAVAGAPEKHAFDAASYDEALLSDGK